MEFLPVEEDSRCPLDAVSIQAGRARVKLGVRFDGLDAAIQGLTLEVGSSEANTGQVSGSSGVYLIEASPMDPYPRVSVQEPPEYVVTLTVTQTS